MTQTVIAQNPANQSSSSQQFIPGLVATYSVSGQTYTRQDEAILFAGAVDDENAWKPDSRLPSGPFRVRWATRLSIVEAGTYRFHFYGQGRFQLWLDGAELLSLESKQRAWADSPSVDLPYGAVELEAEYESLGSASAGLYWSSNHFQLEPIEAVHFSRLAEPAQADHTLGRALSRALRCQACHQFTRDEPPLAAPSLTHLAGNLEPRWLIDHLTATADLDTQSQIASRKMPYYGLSAAEAESIATALFESSLASEPPENWSDSLAKLQLKRKSKDPPVRTTADPAQGQQSFVSQGCIACHQAGELGQLSEHSERAPRTIDLFGGGDLSRLANKRPSAAIARWLSDPRTINEDHRMPLFDLTLHQKLDLHAWLLQAGNDLGNVEPGNANNADNAEDQNNSDNTRLGSEGRPPSPPRPDPAERQTKQEAGRQLIAKYQCAACHRLPQSLQSALAKTRITEQSNWTAGCLSSAAQPNKATPFYKLSEVEQQSLRGYLQSADAHTGADHPEQVLAENNCLSCHRRGTQAGLFKHFVDLAENFPELATQLAAMTPPALGGVGDKLHRHALVKALGPEPERMRDWLDIRMPKFNLSPHQIELLSDYFVSHDRIPDNTTWTTTAQSEDRQDQAYWLAAGRLVTPEGFSCQSCHKIADSQPSGIALNAHGTDLTLLSRRIREPWFYRWVRNPARIVPRMEMPAIQTPVRGVLGDSLDTQLQALWLTLNRPDFRPPKPNPVRVVRNYNDGNDQHAHVLTDVIEAPAVVIRPLVIGLGNRHNLMIDLAHGGLHRWWLGDVARQHTRGKSWYWEPGAESLVKNDRPLESWKIVDSTGETLFPTAPTDRQFAMELDQMQHIAQGTRWRTRLHFSNASGTRSQTLRIVQQSVAIDDFRCSLQTTVQGLTPGQQLRIESPGTFQLVRADDGSEKWIAKFEAGHGLEYNSTAQASSASSQSLDLQALSDQAGLTWECQLTSSIASDKFLRFNSDNQQSTTNDKVAGTFHVPSASSQPSANNKAAGTFHVPSAASQPSAGRNSNQPQQAVKELDCVPGFKATELPLPISEMPIAFAWDEAGMGFVGSLKGRVLQLLDTNNDGWEDEYRLISDEIPTPYGLYAGSEGLDVLSKFGLLRLTPSSYGGPLRDWQVVADGWGYTQDYHDWAVGLERDKKGNYFITLPCQQDDRSPQAAHLRGHALKLVRQATPQNDRLYKVESIAAGLRFPMGLALSSSGELFSSDNQGNYTPFNELNHLRVGKRYGFINKLENKDGFSPPFESPAINIPHPWMRSVNGICFLETPSTANRENLFGPFEGHLLGCEMNGRCLVRMSLQKVNGQYQGAVYPFSLPVTSSRESFEGPIVCEVAPSGDVYIGNLRDSGWGGGNNTGSIVRLRPDGSWPLGIAEVRATKSGLEVHFTQPIDAGLASRTQSYAIRSYTRTPTPAYGGDDQQEQIESIESIDIDDARRRVLIKLNQLRPGAVYELNISAIGPNASSLFPNQAHYTMRAIPQ